MTSYFSSLLTTTTSRVASIKQNLLPSENDGDTEDDTHLCRVLRAYYTEKGRSYPAWLPPDPKAPPPVVIQPVYASTVGSRYGGLQNQPGAAGGGALSSLWDSQPQPQQAQDPQSLRQGRGAPSRLGAGAGAQRHNPFARQQSSQEPQVQARPLPSQRAGSYQAVGASAYGRGGNETPPGSSGGMTASERLRDKFNKTGRVASPVSNASPAAPKMADTVREVVRQNSYGSSASGGGSGNYEDRFMPQDGGYGRRGGGDKPFVAATAPWASNEAEFTGSGYGGSSGARQGLPSGPGVGRKGPGLPSGPRGPR